MLSNDPMTRPYGPRFTLGAILALLGLLILVELLTNIHLPLVRIATSVVLITIGVRMALRALRVHDLPVLSNEALLSTRSFAHNGTIDRDARFDVVLGRGTLDLSELAEPDHDVTVSVQALFGQVTIKPPHDFAFDVEGSSAFGAVRMPEHMPIPPSDHPPRLHLRLDAVFGQCQVVH